MRGEILRGPADTDRGGRRRIDLSEEPVAGAADVVVESKEDFVTRKKRELAEATHIHAQAEAFAAQARSELAAAQDVVSSVHMQAPENSAPLTLEGLTYDIAKDGTVKVPGRFSEALAAHGFKRLS